MPTVPLATALYLLRPTSAGPSEPSQLPLVCLYIWLVRCASLFLLRPCLAWTSPGALLELEHDPTLAELVRDWTSPW